MQRYDILTLCPDFRFVRVEGAEGYFYDVVQKWRVRAHIFALKQSGYCASSVSRARVPPCVFRNFTELDGPEKFYESIWRDGTQFFFRPETLPRAERE